MRKKFLNFAFLFTVFIVICLLVLFGREKETAGQQITGHYARYYDRFIFENSGLSETTIVGTAADTTKWYQLGSCQYFNLFYDIACTSSDEESTGVNVKYELSPDWSDTKEVYWKAGVDSALKHFTIVMLDTSNEGRHYKSFHKPIASAVSPTPFIRWIFRGDLSNDSTKIEKAGQWRQP